ncbi:MAG: hypothetical protein ABIR46_01320, partial [Candidatus Saccharimonadales bacterium]
MIKSNFRASIFSHYRSIPSLFLCAVVLATGTVNSQQASAVLAPEANDYQGNAAYFVSRES